MAVRELNPPSLWNSFADLNAVPRASKQEAAIIEFAREFGESLGLPTVVDSVGNVVIRKPATTGMEDRATIVMQSHLDMVHQKNADVDFDFATEGIQMEVREDWVHAKGTTLGADNGIGVAAIMAILAADDVPHPPIEALFTIDEETGMTGAHGLQPDFLTGEIMLNLDTEDDDVLTIGCAGGCDVTATWDYQPEPLPTGHEVWEFSVTGLTGGHSGMDIHKGRGNANKLANRILWIAARDFGVRVCEINGGGLRNAIPRESFITIAVPADSVPSLADFVKTESDKIRFEYRTTDPELLISLEKAATEDSPTVLPPAVQHQLLGTIAVCPCGIYRMCPEIDGLVQTSNNLAQVIVKDGAIKVLCLTRSGVDSERDDLANTISAGFEIIGANVSATGQYPGWPPTPDASIIKVMADLHQEMFGSPAIVEACHAGLECAIVRTHYPTMQMISFGPNIRGAHSPDEKVQISSVQKFWSYLLETLKRVPKSNA